MKSLLLALLVIAVGASAVATALMYRQQEELRRELQRLCSEQADLRARVEQSEPASLAEHGTTPRVTGLVRGSKGEANPMAAQGDPAATLVSPGETLHANVDAPAEVVPIDDSMVATVAAMVGEQLKADADAETEGEGFAEQVRETLAEIRAEEQLQRIERRRAQRVERIKEEVHGYSERLRLTTYQEEDLVQVLTDNFDQVLKIRDRAEAGEIDWPEARPLMQEQRKAGQDRIKEVLTPDQFAEYEAIQQAENQNRGNNRWGGFGPGGQNDSGTPPVTPPRVDQ